MSLENDWLLCVGRAKIAETNRVLRMSSSFLGEIVCKLRPICMEIDILLRNQIQMNIHGDNIQYFGAEIVYRCVTPPWKVE